MALFINPTFPVPDRSDQTVLHERDEDGVRDVGWSEAIMSDGRPIRIEMWSQDQLSLLTLFVARAGLEHLDDGSAADLLRKEGIIAWKTGVEPRVALRPFEDAVGNSLWSINVVVGDEDSSSLAVSPPIYRNRAGPAPSTIFARRQRAP